MTGARGMLGRAVALALAARGDDVTVLQRRPSGLPLREVLADLGDPDAAPGRGARRRRTPSSTSPRRSTWSGRGGTTRGRTSTGTRRLLAAARAAGVARFVHVSSPSVAHAGDALVGAGAGPADPGGARGHYARSKALAEQAVLTSDDAPPRSARHAGARRTRRRRPDRATRRAGDAQLAGGRRRAPAPGLGARGHPARRPDPRPGPGRAARRGRHRYRADRHHVRRRRGRRARRRPRPGDRPARAGACVVSGGEPRPVAELLASICAAAGAPAPRVSVPARLARVAGAVAETFWRHEPPMTRFLAEQLSTAHWFDQRETRAALGWAPRVGLDEGFRRLRTADPCHPAAWPPPGPAPQRPVTASS